MQKRNLNAQLLEFDDLESLSEGDRELVLAAREALSLSYSPYSNFKVGAAARLKNGSILKGANQENASYPLCLCAERNVLAISSNSYPDEVVEEMAIVVKNPNQDLEDPVSPCGACRQVLAESENRQKSPIRLIMTAVSGKTWIVAKAHDLLPLAFSGDYLK